MFARRRSMLITCWLAATIPVAPAGPLPSAVSINLCTDQLLLSLANREQVLSVSWLAADPAESMLAGTASKIPLNYGTAEEVLRLDPDVVIGGSYSSLHTQSLLRRLGHDVVTISPANDIEQISSNLRQVAQAIDQQARGEIVIAQMHQRIARIIAEGESRTFDTIVVRPGGFTTPRPSLPDSLLRLGGFRNLAAESGLDRWGSLSMESLLAARPSLVVISDYRLDAHSLANTVLEHPVLGQARAEWRIVHIPGRLWACGLPQSLESIELMHGAVSGLARSKIQSNE